MRVTQSAYYNNLDKNNRNIQHELVRVNKQLASGKKIEYGHEDPTIFKDTMKLDNEIKGLEQAKDAAMRAVSFTDYTDSSLGDMIDVLDKFKVKLLNAASDHNATTSLVAIAKELRAYKEHLINLSNSTGDGKYLFAGTTLDVAPINAKGEYKGNDGEMKAFLGNKVEQPYNITGSELFLGENSNVHRKISTNIRLFNQNDLHPESMIQGGVKEQSKEVLLTRSDTIRDLVGDDDDNPENDESTFFYIKGRNSLGNTFKEKFELDGKAKVEDLLDRIGVAFGNTTRSKVVDVSIDEAGYIEITDNKIGSSKIDFHMISSHDNVDDTDDLLKQGSNVQVYNNSEYKGALVNSTVSASNSQFDHRDFEISTAFEDYTGKRATSYALVREAMPEALDELVFNGTDIDGKPVEELSFEVKEETTMQDLLKFIETTYGGEEHKVIARMDQGKILLFDNSIDQKDVSEMSLSMSAKTQGDDLKAFASTSGTEYDRSYWEKDGSRLSTSIPQITKADNKRADGTTKLSEVAGDESMVGAELCIEGKDIYGTAVDYSIHFDKDPECSYFVNNKTEERYDIMSHGYTTGADDVTYQQLFDVMGMIMSNNLPETDPTYIEDYVQAVQDADAFMDIGFDQQGRIVAKDRLNSVTRMEVAIYDKGTNDFSDTRKRHPLLSFHANNTIAIDDPKIDFFDLIEGAIRSVELERKHADGSSKIDPRNIGVQNAIKSIEHLLEHVTNAHSKNGSQSNAIRYTQERNEAWIVNAKGIQSENIDTDMAEASMKYKQLTNNYDAMLSTVSKVNNLSLVNYLK